jgi:hypothetical protein
LGQAGSIALGLAAAIVVSVPAAFAQASVKAVFEKHDLLGTFASDCAKPAAKDNSYFVNRLLDAEHVQRDRMSGPSTRDFALIIDKTTESKPNEVTVSGTIDGQPANSVWRLEQTRMLQLEATEAGKKTIGGGRDLATGKEMPWLNKCVQRITLQSAPDGGGKCIDVPRSEFKAGIRLQMWDCNDTAAQTFSFDASSGRMTIESLCV